MIWVKGPKHLWMIKWKKCRIEKFCTREVEGRAKSAKSKGCVLAKACTKAREIVVTLALEYSPLLRDTFQYSQLYWKAVSSVDPSHPRASFANSRLVFHAIHEERGKKI